MQPETPPGDGQGPRPAITVVVLWPELLGTYGDGGNARVLAQRARWRGIGCEVVEVPPGAAVPERADIYLLGGGEDAAQSAVTRMRAAGKPLQAAIQRGAAVLAVCAGFQLLGEYFTAVDGRRVAGLALIDVRTDRLDERAVGEIVVRPDALPGLPTLTGFENHAGATQLGPQAAPLGRVVSGVGNGGHGAEGVVAGSVIGTYLHGPVLARNPALADHLLSTVTGAQLEPLDDSVVDRLRRERLPDGRAAD